MLVDDENAITNYNRYRIRDIHTTVRELSPERKQKLLNEIQLQKEVCNLTEREYNHQDCERIEKELRTKEPK